MSVTWVVVVASVYISWRLIKLNWSVYSNAFDVLQVLREISGTLAGIADDLGELKGDIMDIDHKMDQIIPEEADDSE